MEMRTRCCAGRWEYSDHLRHIDDVIGRAEGLKICAAMNLLLLQNRTAFLCVAYVNENPTAEQVAGISIMTAEEVRRFGLVPKVALSSHLNFGSSDSPGVRKMAEARV